MSNFLEYIDISNFKSIKHCKIDGCKRINLFIGRPNVGKSNILEALSLFSIPHLKESRVRNLSQLVRLENETELFNDGDFFEKPIQIKTNYGKVEISFQKYDGLHVFIDTKDGSGEYNVDEKLNIRIPVATYFDSAIKKYTFSNIDDIKRQHARYLVPPHGPNLLDVVERNSELKEEISQMFKAYNLQLVFDKASRSLKVMKPGNEEIFLIPYSSIADTLQRVIFFKTAIASNHDSVLLFEEPEAHSFPPFITHITQEMIYKKDNQYFVATHSPFILTDLLENGKEDLAVYVVDYKNNETVVKKLSDKVLHEMYQYGVDLFTNIENFV